METITLDAALEIFEKLPSEEQEKAISIMNKIRIERKREKIAEEADELRKSIKNGTAKSGTIDDLKKDLLS